MTVLSKLAHAVSVVYVIVVLWLSQVYAWVLYPECGIIEFPKAKLKEILLYHTKDTTHTPEKAIVQLALTCTMIKSTSPD